MHRQRLKDTHSILDSHEPETTNMTHLRVRAKKRQMADDRLQTIANENRKLMEKMSNIMRNKGPKVGRGGGKKSPQRLRPLQRGEAIYNKGGLHTVVRRREQNRIASENRAILQRIKNGKNTRSFYDRDVMGKEEKERLKYIKNISKSHQREMRVKKARARKAMMQSSMSTNAMFAPSGGMGSTESGGYGYNMAGSEGYGQILDSSMKVSLHTARQIREDVATQRGMPLPDLMSRRPGEAGAAVKRNKDRRNNQPDAGKERRNEKFTMSHNGAIPMGEGGGVGGGSSTFDDLGMGFGSMSLEEGGGVMGGGDFGDYDYESAEGGRFEGRGYSAASQNRPTTTAQSTRSQVSKD